MGGELFGDIKVEDSTWTIGKCLNHHHYHHLAHSLSPPDWYSSPLAQTDDGILSIELEKSS